MSEEKVAAPQSPSSIDTSPEVNKENIQKITKTNGPLNGVMKYFLPRVALKLLAENAPRLLPVKKPPKDEDITEKTLYLYLEKTHRTEKLIYAFRKENLIQEGEIRGETKEDEAHVKKIIGRLSNSTTQGPETVVLDVRDEEFIAHFMKRKKILATSPISFSIMESQIQKDLNGRVKFVFDNPHSGFLEKFKTLLRIKPDGSNVNWNYCQGCYEGRIIYKSLFAERVSTLSPTSAQKKSVPIDLGFAYLSDEDPPCPCAFSFGGSKDGSSWMITLVSNTTASAEEQETFVLCSNDLLPHATSEEQKISSPEQNETKLESATLSPHDLSQTDQLIQGKLKSAGVKKLLKGIIGKDGKPNMWMVEYLLKKLNTRGLDPIQARKEMFEAFAESKEESKKTEEEPDYDFLKDERWKSYIQLKCLEAFKEVLNEQSTQNETKDEKGPKAAAHEASIRVCLDLMSFFKEADPIYTQKLGRVAHHVCTEWMGSLTDNSIETLDAEIIRLQGNLGNFEQPLIEREALNQKVNRMIRALSPGIDEDTIYRYRRNIYKALPPEELQRLSNPENEQELQLFCREMLTAIMVWGNIHGDSLPFPTPTTSAFDQEATNFFAKSIIARMKTFNQIGVIDTDLEKFLENFQNYISSLKLINHLQPKDQNQTTRFRDLVAAIMMGVLKKNPNWASWKEAIEGNEISEIEVEFFKACRTAKSFVDNALENDIDPLFLGLGIGLNVNPKDEVNPLTNPEGRKKIAGLAKREIEPLLQEKQRKKERRMIWSDLLILTSLIFVGGLTIFWAFVSDSLSLPLLIGLPVGLAILGGGILLPPLNKWKPFFLNISLLVPLTPAAFLLFVSPSVMPTLIASALSTGGLVGVVGYIGYRHCKLISGSGKEELWKIGGTVATCTIVTLALMYTFLQKLFPYFSETFLSLSGLAFLALVPLTILGVKYYKSVQNDDPNATSKKRQTVAIYALIVLALVYTFLVGLAPFVPTISVLLPPVVSTLLPAQIKLGLAVAGIFFFLVYKFKREDKWQAEKTFIQYLLEWESGLDLENSVQVSPQLAPPSAPKVQDQEDKELNNGNPQSESETTPPPPEKMLITTSSTDSSSSSSPGDQEGETQQGEPNKISSPRGVQASGLTITITGDADGKIVANDAQIVTILASSLSPCPPKTNEASHKPPVSTTLTVATPTEGTVSPHPPKTVELTPTSKDKGNKEKGEKERHFTFTVT